MKCSECNKGTIKKVIIEKYNARLKGISFPVQNAEFEECDACKAKSYSAKEIRRWERVLDEYLTSSGLLLTPSQIIKVRETLEMSVIDFAQLLGVTRQAVYSWERNDTKPLSIGPTSLLLSLLQEEKDGKICGITDSLINAAKGRGIEIQAPSKERSNIKFPSLRDVPRAGKFFTRPQLMQN